MVSQSTLRLGALSAIAFVLLTLFAALVPHEALPEEQPASEDVRAFFERNAAMQAAQPYTKALGAFALLGFVAVLSVALREAGAPVAAAVVLAGGAAFAGSILVIMLVIASIVTLAPVLEGNVVYAVYNIAWIANVRAGLAAAPFLLGAGVGILHARVLPRWTGAAALVAAALVLAGGAAAIAVPGPAGIGPAFLGFVASLLWLLAAGIAMMVRATRAPEAALPGNAAGSTTRSP